MSTKYGRKGQEWHPEFVKYIESVVEHEVYTGMPDVYKDNGLIQWEAPSNRSSGKFQHTHHKRRDWWRKKALDSGIDPESPQWISRTAKQIHPTGTKPCRNCGRFLEIRYTYPNSRLLKRIKKLNYYQDDFALDPLENVLSLFQRLCDYYGETTLLSIPSLLKTPSIQIPTHLNSLEDWLNWIDKQYIPAEPRLLSPGVMSNAPDRLDGFHHFNRCCRSSADKGRRKQNLQSYTTDRRVFEHWADGDWIAADRLMGQIRSRFDAESCLNHHPGPCNADHIGPISLGFAHRPEFQLLCSSCNSSKNNRMSFNDVLKLLNSESNGITVTSWYSKKLWLICKSFVVDDETALRLSKLLRDNRHTALSILYQVFENNHLVFLSSLLGLHYADYDVEFIDLQIQDSTTHYSQIKKTKRTTKYAIQQKARRLRIAFQALSDYSSKQNRNSYIIETPQSKVKLNDALAILSKNDEQYRELDNFLANALDANDDLQIKSRIGALPLLPQEPPHFKMARQHLEDCMAYIAIAFSQMWEDDRYIRSKYES